LNFISITSVLSLFRKHYNTEKIILQAARFRAAKKAAFSPPQQIYYTTKKYPSATDFLIFSPLYETPF